MRLAIAFLALPLAACVGIEPVTASKPVALSSAQVANIKGTVTYDFFDGPSAIFRNVRAADVTLKSGQQIRRVCGEVNGKNRMGGYVGFEMFGGVMVGGKFSREDFFGACE